MSLADELLADLEDIGDVQHVEDENENEVEEVTMEVDKPQKDAIRSIAKLRDSKQLVDIMNRIQHFQHRGPRKEIFGPVEQDPEYKLIVEANNISVEIDNEINIVHKFTRDIYSKRFPELDQLVPTSIDYVKTVKALGNDVQRAKANELLVNILTPATIMIVSVTASTTQGVDLNEVELTRVVEAANMSIELDDARTRIFEYVKSRMTVFAPNLSFVVGPTTAAKLMGIAGGLTNLSKMPSCNVLVLGAQKRTLSGFSTTAILPHTGYIFYCDLVQSCPSDLRKKVARLVAGKVSIAARVDAFHEAQDGRIGNDLFAEIEHKIEKLQEPAPVKQVKALPVPLELPRKKRGGRRARRTKERLGMSALRKAANRTNFAEIGEDAYQEDIGFSLGNIGKANSGRIRAAQVDSKTKAKISKSLQKTLQKHQTWGGTTSVRKQVAGTASSIAFTPLQGLEIVNPNAAEKRVEEANQKYFSNQTGFVKVASVIPKSM